MAEQEDAQIAAAAQHAAESRLMAYAQASGVASRQGQGWFAVLTGVDSNDMNGVVSQPQADITAELAAELVDWFAGAFVPASWMTKEADLALTAVLVAAGARPERTGSWSGCPIPPLSPANDRAEVIRVDSDRDLDGWLEVAAACRWIESDGDRQLRRRLYRGLGSGVGPLTHWLALDQDEPVGFASSYLDGEVVDLCNLGVAGSHRRRGIGRALVSARLVDAAARGARTVVSAPSHDGWQLQRSLDFRSVPVIPDTCFYLPAPDAVPSS